VESTHHSPVCCCWVQYFIFWYVFDHRGSYLATILCEIFLKFFGPHFPVERQFSWHNCGISSIFHIAQLQAKTNTWSVLVCKLCFDHMVIVGYCFCHSGDLNLHISLETLFVIVIESLILVWIAVSDAQVAFFYENKTKSLLSVHEYRVFCTAGRDDDYWLHFFYSKEIIDSIFLYRMTSFHLFAIMRLSWMFWPRHSSRMEDKY